MRGFDLGSLDPRQYEGMTEEQKEAWHHPEPYSYHSYHIERLGDDWFRWRDSREAKFYVGTGEDLAKSLYNLKLRKVDPKYKEHAQQGTLLKILSQDEIDDLFSDL